MILPVNRLRMASVVAANDTTTHSAIRKSEGERNNTAAARVMVAISVKRRVKMHAFDYRLVR